MYQKQTKNTDCKRQALFVSVLAVTTILLAGDVCAYVSNHRMSQVIGKSFSTLNNTVDNLDTFLNSIPQEIDFIVDSSSVPINEANESLLDIGQTLGAKILTQLGRGANTALDKAEKLLGVIGKMEQELQTINKSSSHLQQLQKELAENLTTLGKAINKTLQDCGPPCQNVSVGKLEPGANFSMVPDLSRPLQLITNLTSSNPNATIAEARKALEDIPEKVSNQTQKVVSDAQGHLRRLKQEIGKIRSNFSILSNIKNITKFLDDLTKDASSYEPVIVKFNGYRWIVCLILCCLVLLIIICNVLGLLCGPLGLNPRVLPTKRSCLSNSGGDFLMAGVGFSFIFSWLLMTVVLLTFFIGGNMYTLLCRSWASGRLLQFLETPGLFPDLNPAQLLHLNSSEVTLSSLYNNCSNNAPLWSTLHLDEVYPLDGTLNISEFTKDFDSALNKLNVSVNTPDLLSDKQKSLLQDLGKKEGLLDLNFTSALEELNKGWMQEDLTALAEKLEKLANQSGIDSTTRDQLRAHATELRNIQSTADSSFHPEIEILKTSILSLQESISNVSGLVNSTLTAVEEAQRFMTQKATEVVKNESSAFVHLLLGFFESYLDWAKSIIRGQMARCGPVAWTLDSVHTIVCNYTIDSLNAFWFSLGWCTIFLLPSIILAVRLAKFYRRMRVADLYEDEEMMELSTTSNMFQMPRAKLRK
ncbi:prominin-1-A-like isoform X2 [Hemicordylus capensis]|nr:prominin-1-A-like isoform X2 [Hemicordylus capensis]